MSSHYVVGQVQGANECDPNIGQIAIDQGLDLLMPVYIWDCRTLSEATRKLEDEQVESMAIA